MILISFIFSILSFDFIPANCAGEFSTTFPIVGDRWLFPNSPIIIYIINAKINYNLKKLEWDNNLIFNIWGDRLTFITGALDPDVYERSRPSLDFITSKKFNRVTLGFFIQNILDMEYKKSFDFTGDYIYESFRKNRSYEINLKYRIK